MANATPGEQKVTVENIEQRSRKTPKIEQSSRYRLTGSYILLLPLNFEIAASVFVPIFMKESTRIWLSFIWFPTLPQVFICKLRTDFFPALWKIREMSQS